MAKLRETEILTNKVYLNIENDDEVETKSMSTEDALADYGDLEVLSVGEPRYGSSQRKPDNKRGRSKRAGEDTRQEGMTDILLQA